MSKAIRLIVGLGNPGPEYAGTRHNAGFRFVDALARREGAVMREERKFQAEVGRIRVGEREVWLLKPLTFMNNSGRAVQAAAQYYKISPEEILVAHDELDIDPGQMRLKQGGGHAGHNGLRDIAAQLGTPDFWRLRLGVGHPRRLQMAQQVFDFVLSAPSREHQAALDACIDAALKVVNDMAEGDMTKATRALAPFSGSKKAEKDDAKKEAAPKKGKGKASGPKRGPILVSACLLGEACRYDGRTVPSVRPILEARGYREGDIVAFCPEVAGGLSVPRAPAEIIGGAGAEVVEGQARVKTQAGVDVTDAYLKGARDAVALARKRGVACALMRSKSPSCGRDSVYDGTFTGTLRPGQGVAADLLTRRMIPIYTETELDQVPEGPAAPTDSPTI